MAQTNYTPISLYYSATATNVPTAGNLVAGELALNTADGKLFYKDSAGVVQTLASKDTNSGTFTNISVSGVASFADGTVLLPSITNIGDTNTGIYFPAADTIAFTEGGVESMRIDASGNVGIGITPVSQKLEVKGNQRLVGDSAYILWRDTADSASSGVIQFPSASAATIGTYVNQAMLFQTNNSERIRIDTSGNVGIGTSSPSASAILDAQSTTKGVRMPNMTTTQKNAISSPAAGLMVFDTTLAKLCVYSGSAWQTITSI